MSNEISRFVIASVRMTTNQLTDQELAATYNAASANFNPKAVMGYEKAKPLFTEADGTRMHRDTLAALEVIVEERLSRERK